MTRPAAGSCRETASLATVALVSAGLERAGHGTAVGSWPLIAGQRTYSESFRLSSRAEASSVATSVSFS